MGNRKIPPGLQTLIPVADAIAAAVGPYCEVVLHDMSRPAQSVVYMTGNVTKEGKALRSSTTFVRDGQGKVIGCLCVNIDQTPLVSWRHFLENSLFSAPSETKETFAAGMTEALNDIVQSVLEGYGGDPGALTKEDKTAVVQQLEERGVFLMKGSVEMVAGILGVTRYTVYNYIDAVRSKAGEIKSE